MNHQAENSAPSGSGLHIDDDWKSQAQAEKERLAEKVGDLPGSAGSTTPEPIAAEGGTGLPSASFELLVEQYATQILVAMGQMPDAGGKPRPRDLGLARLYIDMLGIIQEKTKGNLTPPEQALIDSLLYQMRMAYVAEKSRPPR